MSELTPEQKYYAARKVNIIVIVLSAAIIAFLLTLKCNGEKSANAAYNAIKDTLQSVLADTSRVRAIARGLEQENADLDLHIADLVEDLQLTKGALIDESDKANRFAAAYAKAKSKKDTVQALNNCDSLAAAHWELLAQLWHRDSLDIEIHNVYRAVIKNMTAQRDNFKFAYDSCVNAVEFSSEELPKIKPRAQWFITGGGFITGPVYGVNGGVTHVTKKGLLIAVKPMLTNYGKGGMLEIGITLK